MKYIWDGSLRTNEAALSLYLYRELKEPDTITVNFGVLKKTFGVVVKENLSDKTVGLPAPLTDKYTIPADIPYEIYDKGGEIYLGPVIAYVLKKPFANLNKRLSRHLPRFWEYESIKGLIFACSTDSINPEKNLIEGYYYSPKKLYNPWKYGRFPLPDAVFEGGNGCRCCQQQNIASFETVLFLSVQGCIFYHAVKRNVYGRLNPFNP